VTDCRKRVLNQGKHLQYVRHDSILP